MHYMSIFRKTRTTKDGAEIPSFWASISTEKVKKNKKGRWLKTGEYAQANIEVRLSDAALEVFDEYAKPTKKKGIEYLRAEINAEDLWLKARDYEDDDGNVIGVVFVYILDMNPADAHDDGEEDE